MAEKPHYAVVEFNTYRNLQRHRAVLPAIAWLLHTILYITLVCLAEQPDLRPGVATTGGCHGDDVTLARVTQRVQLITYHWVVELIEINKRATSNVAS